MDQSSRRFGRYGITILHDGVFEAPADVLVHERGAEALRAALDGWGQSQISIGVNCFLLRDEAGLTLVDAGTGSSWGERLGHARAALQRLDVSPDQIGRILLTHIHGDHALGLFDGEAPYFPNARIGVPHVDLSFFTDDSARENLPEERRSGFAIAAALQRHYGERIDALDEGEVAPGITLLPLPGHTPGHGGYLVTDERAGLLIWGDVLHLAELQPGDPEIGIVYDIDSALAARTRRFALAQALEKGWLVAGGHIPGFQRVLAEGKNYRLAPA